MPAGAQARSSISLRLFSTWSSTSSRLFSSLVLDFLSTFHYLRPDFSSTFLIFGVSSPQVSLEKVDDFSFFSRREDVKQWSLLRESLRKS